MGKLTKRHILIASISVVLVLGISGAFAFRHLVSAAPLARHGVDITPITKTSHTTAQGFDICEAPPLSTMQTWWAKSPYRWVNIYFGGLNRACPNGPSAEWVAAVYNMGWGLVPTYVGFQAPDVCLPVGVKGAGMVFDPSVAQFEGQQSAEDAAVAAQQIGLAPGTILYYDMEYYYQPGQMPLCDAAVDAYLGGWDEGLHTEGYKAGVYIAGTNVGALERADIQEPDAVWLVNSGFTSPVGGYAATCTVYGNAQLADGAWHGHRLYQYLVNSGQHLDHSETWGGVSQVIDSDCADGDIVGHEAPVKLAPSFTYVGQNADGRLIVFARGQDNAIWFAQQNTPNGLWSTWAHMAATPTFAGNPQVAQLLDGRLAVFALGTDHALWWAAQTAPNKAFGAWQPVAKGQTFSGNPAIGRNADGSLSIFALGKDGNIWQTSQTASGNAWGTWQPLQAGQHFLATPTIAQDSDGRLEVFAVGKDGNIWVNFQRSLNRDWFGWLPLQQPPAANAPTPTPGTAVASLKFAGTPATTRTPDGRLAIFARGADGTLWQNSQKTEGGTWAGWALITTPAPITGDPAIGTNQNGLLVMLALGNDSNMWESELAGTNHTWLPWNTLEDGVTFTGTPAIGKGADGRLLAFALGTDGDLWATQQQTPGGIWSTWAHLEDNFAFQQ